MEETAEETIGWTVVEKKRKDRRPQNRGQKKQQRERAPKEREGEKRSGRRRRRKGAERSTIGRAESRQDRPANPPPSTQIRQQQTLKINSGKTNAPASGTKKWSELAVSKTPRNPIPTKTSIRTQNPTLKNEKPRATQQPLNFRDPTLTVQPTSNQSPSQTTLSKQTESASPPESSPLSPIQPENSTQKATVTTQVETEPQNSSVEEIIPNIVDSKPESSDIAPEDITEVKPKPITSETLIQAPIVPGTKPGFEDSLLDGKEQTQEASSPTTFTWVTKKTEEKVPTLNISAPTVDSSASSTGNEDTNTTASSKTDFQTSNKESQSAQVQDQKQSTKQFVPENEPQKRNKQPMRPHAQAWYPNQENYYYPGMEHQSYWPYAQTQFMNVQFQGSVQQPQLRPGYQNQPMQLGRNNSVVMPISNMQPQSPTAPGLNQFNYYGPAVNQFYPRPNVQFPVPQQNFNSQAPQGIARPLPFIEPTHRPAQQKQNIQLTKSEVPSVSAKIQSWLDLFACPYNPSDSGHNPINIIAKFLEFDDLYSRFSLVHKRIWKNLKQLPLLDHLTVQINSVCLNRHLRGWKKYRNDFSSNREMFEFLRTWSGRSTDLKVVWLDTEPIKDCRHELVEFLNNAETLEQISIEDPNLANLPSEDALSQTIDTDDALEKNILMLLNSVGSENLHLVLRDTNFQLSRTFLSGLKNRIKELTVTSRFTKWELDMFSKLPIKLRGLTFQNGTYSLLSWSEQIPPHLQRIYVMRETNGFEEIEILQLFRKVKRVQLKFSSVLGFPELSNEHLEIDQLDLFYDENKADSEKIKSIFSRIPKSVKNLRLKYNRLGCNDMRGWWRYLNNQGLETLALENFSQEALSDLKDFLANDFRLKTSLNTITIKVNDEIVILEEFKKDLEKQNINLKLETCKLHAFRTNI